MPHSRAWLAVPLVAVTALAITGCDRSRTAHPARGRVEIKLTEFHISPQRIRLPPGPATFVIHNDGVLPHRFALGRGRQAVGDPPVIAPGATARLRVDLPRGHYRIFCALSNHDVLGMDGRVTVKP